MAKVVRTGVVKWFDPLKRFGFITLTDVDPPEDAMLHVSCLRDFKTETLAKNAVVRCVVDKGAKGLQVSSLVEITQPSETERLALFVKAHVKWFNVTRGYGFVSRGPGTPDVFVHAETIKGGHVADLYPNQEVLVLIEEGPKGPKALDVRPAP